MILQQGFDQKNILKCTHFNNEFYFFRSLTPSPTRQSTNVTIVRIFSLFVTVSMMLYGRNQTAIRDLKHYQLNKNYRRSQDAWLSHITYY